MEVNVNKNVPSPIKDTVVTVENNGSSDQIKNAHSRAKALLTQLEQDT